MREGKAGLENPRILAYWVFETGRNAQGRPRMHGLPRHLVRVAALDQVRPFAHEHRFDRLEAQLEGGALPDWMQRFGELQAAYPEWSGHAPRPGE